jgi:O-succinylbenzoate synthase
MKLKTFEIYTYSKKTTLGFDRKGIYIRIQDSDGREGVGEIAPLENRSVESFESSLFSILSIRKKFLTKELTEASYPPSVIFGLEMALISLSCQVRDEIKFKLYSDKIKLKNLTVDESIRICKEKLKSQSQLRVDMNESFSLDDAIRFTKAFDKTDFLYIEEPTESLSDLVSFYEETNFPYAIDEKLVNHPIERVQNLKGLTHLIIKPTILGGEKGAKEIIDKTPHLKHVFSSSYETEVGLLHIARIASNLSPNEAVGIDTLKIFKEAHNFFDPKSELLKPVYFSKPNIPWNQFTKVI